MTRLAHTLPLLWFVTAAASAQSPPSVGRTEQASGTSSLLIAVSPVNEKVVWVSGSRGTWVRTVDGGTTWTTGRVPGADSLQFRDVYAVNANTAYLLSIGDGPQSRIYKTTDGGTNWQSQFVNDDPKGFFDCMDFWDAKRGLVIGDAVDGNISMLRTEDGGAHWTRVPAASLPPAQPQEGSFAASGTCLVTGKGGHAWIVASTAEHGRLLHTSDYGRSWAVDTLPLTTRAGSGPQSVTFRDARHGMVLGGGNSAASGDVLIAVTDKGGTRWTARTSPPLARGVWGGVYVPKAKRPTVVAVGPSGAMVTRDEGITWSAIDSVNYWSVGFASPNAGWAVGMGGRITKLSGF
ncbi:MAG: hypothetical protein IPP90_06865 [Gemmatimonadaceae bacterium]|nr:hypothetical protein [Gemmatimonadaceae bacterium]